LATILTDLMLKDILKRMEGIYKTIDLRTACFKEGAEWQNALTVIRFSHSKAGAVRKIYDYLHQKWGGRVDTPRLKVLCQALPISKYGGLTRGLLENGTLSFKNLTVKFEGKKDIDSWRCTFTDCPHYLRRLEKWKIFDGVISRSSNIYEKLEHVESDARSLRFAGIYNCINEWLQSRFSSNVSTDITFSAPVYAIIDDVDVKDSSIKIRISSHKNMVRSLHLDLLQWKGRGFWGQSIEKTDELISTSRKDLIAEEPVEVEPTFQTFEVDYEIPSWNPTDYLDAKLIYDRVEILEIDNKEGTLAGFRERKAPVANPFFWAYDRFCSYDELIKQLKDPQRVATSKKREPSQIFERAVSWLLTLCGLQTIKLDEYEKLTPKAGKIQYDSVDIIAYSREKSLIVLASCTTGLPKSDEDVPRLLDVTKRLEQDLFKETSTKLVPVIFSSLIDLELVKDEGMKCNVKIVDSSDTERMVKLLRDGKTQDALALIIE